VKTKTLARVGGLLYLADGIAGGFSEYVRTSNTVQGDAVATASNVASHLTLFRMAFATDLSDLLLYLTVGIILFTIFRPINGPVALAMLLLNSVSVPIQALNMLSHGAVILLATQSQFAMVSSPTMLLLLLDLHRVGYLIAQIFFGLYLLPLGYLVYRSGYLPRLVGVVLMVGAAGYAAGVGFSLAAPGFQSSLATAFGLVGGIAELVFLLWLLIGGIAEPRQGALKWAA